MMKQMLMLLACTSEPEPPPPLGGTGTPTDSPAESGTTGDTSAGWPGGPEIALGGLDPGLQIELSGADLDGDTLWVVRSLSASSSALFRLRRVADGFEPVEVGGQFGWPLDGDVEGVAALAGPDELLIVSETADRVRRVRVEPSGVVELQHWDLTGLVPSGGSNGAEGIAWLPDDDAVGLGIAPGTGSLGGLALVGHQQGGHVYLLDLLDDGTIGRVVDLPTALDETASVDVDPLTGAILLWHGSVHNTLEETRFEGNALVTRSLLRWEGVENIEGVSVGDTCRGDVRDLVLTIDGGGERALLWFAEWPC